MHLQNELHKLKGDARTVEEEAPSVQASTEQERTNRPFQEREESEEEEDYMAQFNHRPTGSDTREPERTVAAVHDRDANDEDEGFDLDEMIAEAEAEAARDIDLSERQRNEKERDALADMDDLDEGRNA